MIVGTAGQIEPPASRSRLGQSAGPPASHCPTPRVQHFRRVSPHAFRTRFSARPNVLHGPRVGAPHGHSRRGLRGRSLRVRSPVRARGLRGRHGSHGRAHIHPNVCRARDERAHRGNSRHGLHAPRKHGHIPARERANDRRERHMPSCSPSGSCLSCSLPVVVWALLTADPSTGRSDLATAPLAVPDHFPEIDPLHARTSSPGVARSLGRRSPRDSRSWQPRVVALTDGGAVGTPTFNGSPSSG